MIADQAGVFDMPERRPIGAAGSRFALRSQRIQQFSNEYQPLIYQPSAGELRPNRRPPRSTAGAPAMKNTDSIRDHRTHAAAPRGSLTIPRRLALLVGVAMIVSVSAFAVQLKALRETLFE